MSRQHDLQKIFQRLALSFNPWLDDPLVHNGQWLLIEQGSDAGMLITYLGIGDLSAQDLLNLSERLNDEIFVVFPESAYTVLPEEGETSRAEGSVLTRELIIQRSLYVVKRSELYFIRRSQDSSEETIQKRGVEFVSITGEKLAELLP